MASLRANRYYIRCCVIGTLLSISLGGRLIASPFFLPFTVCEYRNNLYGGTGGHSRTASGCLDPMLNPLVGTGRQVPADLEPIHSSISVSLAASFRHLRVPNKYIRRCHGTNGFTKRWNYAFAIMPIVLNPIVPIFLPEKTFS